MSWNGILVAGGGKSNKSGLWLWDARPLTPAPYDRRLPLLEVTKGWDVGRMVAGPRPRAEVRANFGSRPGSILAARVVASPDLSLAVAIAKGPKVQIVDIAAGKVRHELTGLTDGITARVVSADARLVAAAGGPTKTMSYEIDPKTNKYDYVYKGEDGPGVAMVWDAATGRELATFRAHTAPIGGVAISPDGAIVATTSPAEKKVRLWEVQTGREVAVHEGVYFGPRFESDGRRLIVQHDFDRDSKRNSETVFLDWRSGKVERAVAHPQKSFRALSPDGKVLVQFEAAEPKNAGLFDVPYVMRIIDPETGQIKRTLEEPAGRIEHVEFGPKPGQITVVVGRRVLRIWDLASGKPFASYDHGCEHGLAVAFSANTQRIAILPNGSDVLSVWDVARLRPFESDDGGP